MPSHIELDRMKEEKGRLKIGTKMWGMGGVFEDFMGRKVIILKVLLDTERLRQNIENALYDKNSLIHELYGGKRLDVERIVDQYSRYVVESDDFFMIPPHT